MDKNEFDKENTFDFEKEYGFDPKDFMSSEDDFNFSDFLNGDLEYADEEIAQEAPAPAEEAAREDAMDDTVVYEPDENLAADFSRMLREAEPVTFQEPEEEPAEEYTQQEALEESEEEPQESEEYVEAYDEEEPAEEEDDEDDEDDEYEERPFFEEEKPEGKPAKKKPVKVKLPKVDVSKLKEKLPKMPEKAPKDPDQKSTFTKLMEIYLEPLNHVTNEADVLDPTDPKYLMQRRREKQRIFKEVTLPAIIAGAAMFLILSFLVGSVSNAISLKKLRDNAAQTQAQMQASAADREEAEFKQLLAEANRLAVGYNYDEAIALLDSFSSTNDKFVRQINAEKSTLSSEKDRLLEWKDVSGIPNLSFHVLMADAARACNREVSGAELAGLYNKNFVSVEEFSRILNQLYASNYVLVDFNSFVSTVPGVDGNQNFFTTSLFLPEGKRPVMITETMVNYFEYMVDPDKDGTPDAKGHGFANRLVVDEHGDIKAAYVDAAGQDLVGNYDLVPVLEAFIQEHPDFSYRGARAILAVTGTEGVFGYRTNTSYVQSRGQDYYDAQVAEAKRVVAALREKGYTIASYTYSNQAYRSMSTLQIQGEMQNWTNQVTPVLGEVDTIVFARNSDIESYSGTTFNVLYNSGLRFFLNSGSSPRVDANTTFIRQTRIMVTGEAMAWYTSQFSEYFDCNVVMDLNSRGSTPAKS